MIAYIARRLLSGGAVLAGLVMFTFLATYLIGDPVNLLVDREFSTDADRQAILRAGGFDRPLGRQFLDFAGGAARGNFGTSIWQNRPASRVVLERLPATALLAVAAMLVTVAVSIPAAVIAGRYAGRWPDAVITTLAVAGASTASFWWALMLISVLAVRMTWLPTSGYGGVRYLVLPVLAMSPQAIGRVTQVLQANVADQLRQGYVSTARAKGLRERTVMGRHVLRNTLLVAVTLVGVELAALLSGAVLVESIFAWPGVGQVALQAIQRRDLPVLIAAVFYIGVVVTVLNIAVDTTYTALDPRVRLG